MVYWRRTPLMPEDSEIGPRPARPHPLAIIGMAFAAVFAVVALVFIWQVFSYYRLIKSGAIINLPQYSSRLTLGNVRERAAPPVADVVTADDPSIGPADAKVTIVEFADFQCPFSREAFTAVRQVLAEFPNDVRLIYRDFPLDAIHPLARNAAKAADCAAVQGKFLPMHDKLFQNADALKDNDLRFYAQQIGLDPLRFEQCMAAPATGGEIDQDVADGAAAGVRGTPTFFINGARVEGAIPYNILHDVVQQIISGQKGS